MAGDFNDRSSGRIGVWALIAIFVGAGSLFAGDPVSPGDLPLPDPSATGEASVDQPLSYRRDIRPILSDRCFQCHGPDSGSREAGLRLDRTEAATAERKGNPAIVPGNSAASALVARIYHGDPDERMPPTESAKSLSDADRALLVRWIDEGAVYETHWAYEAPVRPPVPTLADGSKPAHPIDAFVQKRLEGVGLFSSPRTDRASELRRVTLDLTGLPPTVRELDAYLADDASGAYERAVDRLLGSVRHAEHSTRHWLDAARYADTHGLHLDNERVMWPYRDRVIAAIQSNQPFDEFTIEQLAGDLLPEATLEQRIASGFNRCHVTTSEGGAINEEYLVKYATDRVETVTTVWLGMTAGCAACHDHKFDPLSQKEFTGLFAFFNSTTEAAMDGNAKAPVPVVRVPTAEQESELLRLDGLMGTMRTQRDAPDPAIDAEQGEWEERFRTDRADRWQLLTEGTGVTLASVGGATVVAKPDGSFLLTEKKPDTDVLTLTATVLGTGWRSFRLEALTDPTLPKGGPGRADNSNFVLNEILATVTDAAGVEHPIDWTLAWADHDQPDWRVAEAIDGDLGSTNGWAGEGFNRQERRLAIFASDTPFGVDGVWTLTVKMHYLSPYGAHVLGRTRYALARTIEPEIAERPWIDDDEDLGAERKNDGMVAAWSFVRAPGAPVHSGELAREQRSGDKKRLVQHYFHKAKRTRTLAAGDAAYAWVWLDPEDPPETVMLQFHDEKNWEHRAFWGDDKIVFGGIGADTPAHRRLGDLPPLGEWVRLVVPMERVGIEPRQVLSGVAFTQFGGHAFWDEAGFLAPDHELILESIVATRASDRDPVQADLLKNRYRLDHSPRHATLLEDLAAAERDHAALSAMVPTTLVSQELPEPRPAFLLARGAYDHPTDRVERDTPSFLPPFPEGLSRDRLGFSQWLVADENPLTARVTVNRIWQQLFGTGLVRTSEDFGSQGEWPSHPELLDWLAVDFREGGWDLRALVRQLVTSETYRQSSNVTEAMLERDPENRFLARSLRHRLDAEVIRDQALYVSGLLVEEVGGPPVKPYQPSGVWEAVGYTDSNTRMFAADTGDALHRRSLYTFWKRTAPPPSMAIFDAPNRETCTVRRERTNTPLAALVLWNDVQFVEAARHFAARILKEGGPDDAARLVWGFRSLTGRVPTAEEADQLAAALGEFREVYSRDPEAARALISLGAADPDPTATHPPSELAGWTMLASLLLNLDEAITRG